MLSDVNTCPFVPTACLTTVSEAVATYKSPLVVNVALVCFASSLASNFWIDDKIESLELIVPAPFEYAVNTFPITAELVNVTAVAPGPLPVASPVKDVT